MSRTTCYYRFPCHPEEMFRNSPKLSDESRMLRINMIKQLAELSSHFPQEDLDTKVYADVEDDEIVGFDMAELQGVPDMSQITCVGTRRIPLGQLSAAAWTTMRVPPP